MSENNWGEAMTGVRCALAVLAALAALPTTRAAEVPGHHLADRALAIFRQRCVGCHGGAEVRGELAILDHSALVASKRKLIVPDDPDGSPLLTRVRVGSMPPGKHAKLSASQVDTLQSWIAAGAEPFSGGDYILRHVLDDVGKLPVRERRTARYLSFDHLLNNPDADRELQRRRTALGGVLQHFAGKKDALLRPVDEAGLLFRIDLRDFGWQQRPLEIVGAPAGEDVSLLTRFDLLLLEYRYAMLPSDARLASELGEKFYDPSMPVRPIGYLRGDWVAARVLDPPLAAELRTNASELPPPADVPRPVEQPAGKTDARRIVPFDSVLLEPDDSSPFDLVLTDDTLQPGQRVAVSLKNPTREDVWVEAVHTDPRGRKTVLSPPTLLPAGETVRLPKENGPGGAVAGDGGRELVTLFVFPKKFDGGQVQRGDGLVDRFVHPFYALDARGRLRDPEADLSRMHVRTVALKVAERK